MKTEAVGKKMCDGNVVWNALARGARISFSRLSIIGDEVVGFSTSGLLVWKCSNELRIEPQLLQLEALKLQTLCTLLRQLMHNLFDFTNSNRFCGVSFINFWQFFNMSFDLHISHLLGFFAFVFELNALLKTYCASTTLCDSSVRRF